MPITKGQIVEAIQEGTVIANRRYEDWSNGLWVTDSGVEGLLAANIAEAIHARQRRQESLMMELAFKDIADLSGAEPVPGPRPAAVQDTNRADIVLLNRNKRPICAIEVKRSWNGDACLTDLDRIYGLTQRFSYRRGGSLRRGFLAMMIAKGAILRQPPNQRIIEQIARIQEVVRQHFRRRTDKLVFYRGDPVPLGARFREVYGEWAAASLCIEIYVGG